MTRRRAAVVANRAARVSEAMAVLDASVARAAEVALASAGALARLAGVAPLRQLATAQRVEREQKASARHRLPRGPEPTGASFSHRVNDYHTGASFRARREALAP